MNSDYLVIPRMKIHNANALSSPFTIGFPAMTAWLGAVHALQRKLQNQQINVEFLSVGVVSHQFELQTYKGDGDYVHSIIGTANPLDKSGARPAFIEEARCHLQVSLVIAIPEMSGAEQQQLTTEIERVLHAKMKIAGGDILSFKSPYIANQFDDFKNKLMPGYALVERRKLMIEAMESGKDGLDALLSFLTVKNHCEQNEEGRVKWHRDRLSKGWLVPIATGFHGISELGNAKNQRDADCPHRFAESLVTLGEFVMPYRIENEQDMLWQYRTDLDANQYVCQAVEKKKAFNF